MGTALFFAIRQTSVVVTYNVPLSKSYTVCEQACRVLYDFVFICIYLSVIYLLHFYKIKMKPMCNIMLSYLYHCCLFYIPANKLSYLKK